MQFRYRQGWFCEFFEEDQRAVSWTEQLMSSKVEVGPASGRPANVTCAPATVRLTHFRTLDHC